MDIQQKVKHANFLVSRLEMMVRKKVSMKGMIIIEYLRMRKT